MSVFEPPAASGRGFAMDGVDGDETSRIEPKNDRRVV